MPHEELPRQARALFAGGYQCSERRIVASSIEEVPEYYLRGARGPIGGLVNLAGLPGISIPNGFGRLGRPSGVHIIGARGPRTESWDLPRPSRRGPTADAATEPGGFAARARRAARAT